MLGDDIAWALPELRAQAESNMTSLCTITRPSTDKGEMNPVTRKYDNLPGVTTIYTGKCRVQIKSVVAATSDSNAGERLAGVQQFELQIPVSGTDEVSTNDVVEILSSPLDSSLEGRKFTVSGRHEKSQATARRLPLRAVTS